MGVKAETDWRRLEFNLKEGKILYREDNNVYNAGLVWGRNVPSTEPSDRKSV